MPQYRVDSHICHEGVEYPPGSEVSMPEYLAAFHGDSLKEVEPPAPAPAVVVEPDDDELDALTAPA